MSREANVPFDSEIYFQLGSYHVARENAGFVALQGN